MIAIAVSGLQKAMIFNPAQHPRAAQGTAGGLYRGGQFVPSGAGGAGGSDSGTDIQQIPPVPETSFQWFDKPFPADQWAYQAFHKWAYDLSPEDIAAMALYQTKLHVDVNRFLRQKDPRAGTPEVRELVQGLDQAISKGAVSNPVVFWRNMDSPHISKNYASMRGRFISDAGYGSANIDCDSALKRSTDDPHHILCQIRVPRGFPTGFADAVASIGQKEMVMPRGTIYQVTGADTGRGGLKHMALEAAGIDNGSQGGAGGLRKALYGQSAQSSPEDRFVWGDGDVTVSPSLPVQRQKRAYFTPVTAGQV